MTVLVVGLKLLGEYNVYGVYPSETAQGEKHVDTRWEISMRGGVLKSRIVGRGFKSLEGRDDLFAPIQKLHEWIPRRLVRLALSRLVPLGPTPCAASPG